MYTRIWPRFLLWWALSILFLAWLDDFTVGFWDEPRGWIWLPLILAALPTYFHWAWSVDRAKRAERKRGSP